MREPLSQSLAQLLAKEGPPPSLNELLQRTHGRGHFLVLILLCLPFLLPMPVPGFSTVVGLVVLFIGIGMALGRSPHLPAWLGRRTLPAGFGPRLVSGAVRVLRFIERFIRPRRSRWITWRTVRFINGSFICLLAVLLALPIPPVILFSNTLPAIGIIVMAASIMEEDGLMIWAGYAVTIFTVLYLALLGHAVQVFVTGLLKRWFNGGAA